MNSRQQFTPKYWIVHDPNSDDVLLNTARKSRTDAVNEYREACGRYPEDDGMEVSLVEIKLVNIWSIKKPLTNQ